MDLYSGYINKLIDELSGLPGIGSKSAQRLAFHLIGLPEAKVNRIANAMIQARQNVRYCKECFTLTDNELCPICANAERDHSTIMVVENSRDLAAYEKTGKFGTRKNMPKVKGEINLFLDLSHKKYGKNEKCMCTCSELLFLSCCNRRLPHWSFSGGYRILPI